MRKDMAKKFLEPGRGPKTRFPRHCKKFLKTDEDGNFLNNPHGMKKIHRLTPKTADEHGDIGTDFSVLRRFLRSRVGQPWDKVYSEICAEADLRSFPGHHLREWLDYEVEQHCTIDENGEIRDERGNRVISSYWEEFYVHPKTGILQYDGKKNKWKRKPPQQKVFEVGSQLYHEHQGVWYRVKMTELQKRPSRFLGNSYMVYDSLDVRGDVMLKDLELVSSWNVINRLEEEYGHSPDGKVWYCTWKESANSKEIAKIKKLSQAA